MTIDPLETARERMSLAKRRFSVACIAVLRGDSGAETLAKIALAQVEDAREALRRLDASETQ